MRNKMKKNNLFICAILLALAACTPKNQFMIMGSVEGDCDTVYFTGDHSEVIAAAVPVIDGRYQWEGTTDTIVNIWVCSDKEHSQFCRAILEPGTIVVNIPSEDLESVIPSGTPLNDSIAAFQKANAELSERRAAIWEQIMNTSGEERKVMEAQSKAAIEEYFALVAGCLNRNTDNAFGVYLLRFLQFFAKPEPVEDAVLELREHFPDNFWTEFIGGRIEGMMRAAVGRQYTDLTMPTPEGVDMSLSDVIPNNKYTFIDFWASWCGPCRMELPNIKAAYDKYHSQGLEVVGVSFDGEAEAWKKAIAEEDLPWLHMSDLKGWECAAAGVYGIQGIPFTLLVAQDGTIVANNLRGNALMVKLDALMGQ